MPQPRLSPKSGPASAFILLMGQTKPALDLFTQILIVGTISWYIITGLSSNMLIIAELLYRDNSAIVSHVLCILSWGTLWFPPPILDAFAMFFHHFFYLIYFFTVFVFLFHFKTQLQDINSVGSNHFNCSINLTSHTKPATKGLDPRHMLNKRSVWSIARKQPWQSASLTLFLPFFLPAQNLSQWPCDNDSSAPDMYVTSCS